MPGDHIHRRLADGTGRDSYIHITNGGSYTNYKPYDFDKDIRNYAIINKPRIGKVGPDFEEYQQWFEKEHVRIKKENAKTVSKLVDRLNPTNRGSLERTEKDKLLQLIAENF